MFYFENTPQNVYYENSLFIQSNSLPIWYVLDTVYHLQRSKNVDVKT